MKTIKKITLTVFAIFLISFSGKTNAKTFCLKNNTNIDFWIESIYENGDYFGKVLKSHAILKIKPIGIKPIGEGNGPADKKDPKIILFYNYNSFKINFLMEIKLDNIKNKLKVPLGNIWVGDSCKQSIEIVEIQN